MKKYFIDIENLCSLDGALHIYLTDLNHILLSINGTLKSFFAEILGLKNSLNLSIREIFSGNDQAISNIEQENNLVIRSQLPKIFYNKININELLQIDFLTLKMPTFDAKGKIAGVLGISYYLEQFSAISAYKLGLSKREIECLEYLLESKTQKEISRLLKISLRTVESYIKNIKNKLGCDTTPDLLKIARQAKVKSQVKESIQNIPVIKLDTQLSKPKKKKFVLSKTQKTKRRFK